MSTKRYNVEERTIGELGWLPKDLLLRELKEVVEDIYAKRPTEFDINVHASMEELPTIKVRFEGLLFPEWKNEKGEDDEQDGEDT